MLRRHQLLPLSLYLCATKANQDTSAFQPTTIIPAVNASNTTTTNNTITTTVAATSTTSTTTTSTSTSSTTTTVATTRTTTTTTSSSCYQLSRHHRHRGPSWLAADRRPSGPVPPVPRCRCWVRREQAAENGVRKVGGGKRGKGKEQKDRGE
ncbi:hypothetical protein E2C01_064782 [Portunus trituberculatus]|uniref:Uncharacterized protein n=1 Tax=Portunus trituberculatus TaxID=210409 RepID=A0A5B7HCQ8_PORTR|nr:hypothetical protein [Portunus trituberculatus]